MEPSWSSLGAAAATDAAFDAAAAGSKGIGRIDFLKVASSMAVLKVLSSRFGLFEFSSSSCYAEIIINQYTAAGGIHRYVDASRRGSLYLFELHLLICILCPLPSLSLSLSLSVFLHNQRKEQL